MCDEEDFFDIEGEEPPDDFNNISDWSLRTFKKLETNSSNYMRILKPVPEAELEIELDEDSHYRIEERMRWVDPKRSILEINSSCRLICIPSSAHTYQISGRFPLEWAVDSLRRKFDSDCGIVDDPNSGTDGKIILMNG